jgi:hypothetical protein
MKRIILLAVIGWLFLTVYSVHAQNQQIDFRTNWDTTRVLKNPNKGWYHHQLDNGILKYPIKNDSIFASFPGMDHIYLRLAWSYLEPKEGEFDWSYIDRVVGKYVPKGYKISFRITCSETGKYPDYVGEETDGVQYATPSWVEKAGAKGTFLELIEEKIKIWVPKWDDPVYLAKLNQFHKAFAARYDGKPWVSYVDVGSIGDWGEGHTGSSTHIPPTISEMKANMDIYLRNYKKSQLVLCYNYLVAGISKKEEQEIYQYAISHGITIRCDSTLVEGYVHSFPLTWSVSHPQYYDLFYLNLPVIMEIGHYNDVKRNGHWLGKNGERIIPELISSDDSIRASKNYGETLNREIKTSGADIFRGAIRTMHATYIGYHGYAEEWLADNPDLAKELANLCGYWYFPVNASVPGNMIIGENTISLEWYNKGVAPAYHVFSLTLKFEAAKPENSFELSLDDSGNKNWLPEKIKVEKYKFAIPPKTKKGQYKLSFKLTDKTNEKGQDIQLGLKEESIGSQGFVDLAEVSIQ